MSGLKPPTYGDLVNEGAMSGLAEPNVVHFYLELTRWPLTNLWSKLAANV
jgi:hypothetical protein